MAHQVLQALAYLDEQGLTHRALCPTSILLTSEVGTLVTWMLTFDPTFGPLQLAVKVAGYGVYHMTGHGRYVRFPIRC